MKRDADLFGSSDLTLPPTCLITVWAKLSCDPEERLRHPVSLTGIDSDTRKLYISRFLETSTASISFIIIIISYNYHKLKSTDSLKLTSLLVIKYRIVIQQIIQSLHLIQVSTMRILYIHFHVL